MLIKIYFLINVLINILDLISKSIDCLISNQCHMYAKFPIDINIQLLQCAL